VIISSGQCVYFQPLLCKIANFAGPAQLGSLMGAESATT
jgi:hypothetical protein